MNINVKGAAFELAKLPPEDRNLLIKVLEDEAAFNYRLKPFGFVLDPEAETEDTGFFELDGFIELDNNSTLQLCEFPNKPAMCIMGALVAAKFPVTATAGEVIIEAYKVAEDLGIDVRPLDEVIRLKQIKSLIEELRRMEVDG